METNTMWLHVEPNYPDWGTVRLFPTLVDALVFQEKHWSLTDTDSYRWVVMKTLPDRASNGQVRIWMTNGFETVEGEDFAVCVFGPEWKTGEPVWLWINFQDSVYFVTEKDLPFMRISQILPFYHITNEEGRVLNGQREETDWQQIEIRMGIDGIKVPGY